MIVSRGFKTKESLNTPQFWPTKQEAQHEEGKRSPYESKLEATDENRLHGTDTSIGKDSMSLSHSSVSHCVGKDERVGGSSNGKHEMIPPYLPTYRRIFCSPTFKMGLITMFGFCLCYRGFRKPQRSDS